MKHFSLAIASVLYSIFRDSKPRMLFGVYRLSIALGPFFPLFNLLIVANVGRRIPNGGSSLPFTAVVTVLGVSHLGAPVLCMT